MTREIKATYGDSDDWLRVLERDEQKRIQGRQRNLQSQNLALPLVELTDLAHKARIIRERFIGIQDFDGELENIVKLRNAIDHVHEFAANADDLKVFVHRLELTESWIELMQQFPPSAVSRSTSAHT
jgi:hypothetical protein